MLRRLELRGDRVYLILHLLLIINELLIELLLEVEISSHHGNFTVPEVSLISLLLVTLSSQAKLLLKFSFLLIAVLNLFLQLVNSINQSLSISIVGSFNLFSLLALLQSTGSVLLQGFHLSL